MEAKDLTGREVRGQSCSWGSRCGQAPPSSTRSVNSALAPIRAGYALPIRAGYAKPGTGIAYGLSACLPTRLLRDVRWRTELAYGQLSAYAQPCTELAYGSTELPYGLHTTSEWPGTELEYGAGAAVQDCGVARDAAARDAR
eukprot:278916-Rhodomonas_salina.4